MHTETEVDFVNLAKTIWQRRLLVVKLTGMAAAIGFLISFLMPVQYAASITMVQEISDPKITLNEARLSAISALASVAGVDINGLTKAKMSPQTFSKILSSIPFRREMMYTKLNFGKTDAATTFYEYYTKTRQIHPLFSYIFDLPSRLLNDWKGAPGKLDRLTNASSIPQLTREEMAVNKILGNQITIQVLDDEYISIQCTFPEAIAAAQLTKYAGELLQQYLTEIQTEKARTNLQFVQNRHDQSKSNFKKIQEELSSFYAVNKQTATSELKSAVALKSEERRLYSEYRLAENVYSDLTKKLEQSKIVLNEQTPVFKTVDPVTIPIEKSSPNRSKTTVIFAFFGFILSMILILGKGFFEDTMEKWRR